MIGPEISRKTLNQSEVKPKPRLIRVFPRSKKFVCFYSDLSLAIGDNKELKQPRRRRRVRRQVKNEFIFYERNSQLSRSVRFVNGSKNVLELNV